MTETIRLWGGPLHGKTHVLSDTESNVIEIKMAGTIADRPSTRRGCYSRVTFMDKTKRSDFEWDGYIEKATAVEVEQES